MATMTKSATLSLNGGRGIADIANKAQQTASELASDVKNVAREQVTTKVNDQKARAAASIGGIASALRDGSIDQNELLSDYVARAADGLEGVTTYFRDKQLGEIVDDVERFARREPALFLGGAFAVGLLAARFLKSSSRKGRLELDEDDFIDTMPREQFEMRATPRPLAPPAYGANGTGNGSGNGSGNGEGTL